jgi:hypothetical protein
MKAIKGEEIVITPENRLSLLLLSTEFDFDRLRADCIPWMTLAL